MTKKINSKIREKEASLGKKYKIASAGSIKKHAEAVVWLKGEYFVMDGEKIKEDQYEFFVVDGDSMDKFGVKSGDMVVVNEDEKDISDSETSILVLKVHPLERNQTKYKLRKLIGLYDCRDDNGEKFRIWIEEKKYASNIENPEELSNRYIEEDCRKKIEECNCLGCRLLVSKTIRKSKILRKSKIHYSFHPENSIFGRVKYILPKENVKIIEKR
ncbi:MAG: hypothetical protein LBQ70_04720 [Prevotellaceae bacterium]|jgi:hypothetical protein|nr:hypothetical protein [Prevotellaceae bacterium]